MDRASNACLAARGMEASRPRELVGPAFVWLPGARIHFQSQQELPTAQVEATLVSAKPHISYAGAAETTKKGKGKRGNPRARQRLRVLSVLFLPGASRVAPAHSTGLRSKAQRCKPAPGHTR